MRYLLIKGSSASEFRVSMARIFLEGEEEEMMEVIRNRARSGIQRRIDYWQRTSVEVYESRKSMIEYYASSYASCIVYRYDDLGSRYSRAKLNVSITNWEPVNVTTEITGWSREKPVTLQQ